METYEDVYTAGFSDPYYGKSWKGPGQLPIYKQRLTTLINGLFSRETPLGLLGAAADRTVRSGADLRWGKDGKGVRRLLHPNGICLCGTWQIDAAPPGNPYTGYFTKGSEARIIARYSTGGSQPFGGHYRSLSLVGKIYPRTDAKGVPNAPANFFTQQDIATTFSNSIRDGILTNSPPVTPWNRSKDIFQLFWIGIMLTVADTRISERQLYEIAELGKPIDEKTSCPRFMRLTVSEQTPRSHGTGVDFRDEILGILYDPGDPWPSGRQLIFDIAVSDAGKKHRFAGVEWLTGQHWTRIGSITFTEAAASYNGDFVIHFHHPPWRNDRNDPRSVARRELRPTGPKS
jgi:hypothetical protein